MNRSFLYGDGFFETIYIENGNIPLLPYHIARARETSDFFEVEWPEEWTERYWRNQLQFRTLEATGPVAVRITFFRSGSGTYVPEEAQLDFHLLVRTLTKTFELPHQGHFEYTSNPLNAIVYKEMSKPRNALAQFKTTSSAFYVKAGLHLKKHHANALILLNDSGRVCEELKSNIWVRIGGKIVTPPLSEGPLNGTLRRYMLDNLDVVERSITEEELINSKQVWVSSSIGGLTPLILS